MKLNLTWKKSRDPDYVSYTDIYGIGNAWISKYTTTTYNVWYNFTGLTDKVDNIKGTLEQVQKETERRIQTMFLDSFIKFTTLKNILSK